MSTAVTQPALLGEHRIVLHGVSWETYERLLAEIGESRGTRMTFDRGDLEIMSPLRAHEYFGESFGRLIELLCMELEIRFEGGGSTTFKDEELQRGLEPDKCYWIQNERLIRGKRTVDLTVDPPPDLAVEIDITSSSLDKEPVYAALKIPELWRFDGTELTALVLQENGEYAPVPQSRAFPFLTVRDLVPFAEFDDGRDAMTRMRAFVAWVRAQGFRV